MFKFALNTTVEMHSILVKAAKKRGETLNGMIRQILWDWIKQNEGGITQ